MCRCGPLPTMLFGVVLGLLVTLTSVGAGAIGVTVLAALYPMLPAKRLVGSDIAHAVPLTLIGGLGHLGLGNVDPSILVCFCAARFRASWSVHGLPASSRNGCSGRFSASRCATRRGPFTTNNDGDS